MRHLRRVLLIVLYATPILSAQPDKPNPKLGQQKPASAAQAADAKTPPAADDAPAPQPTPASPKPWNLSSEPSILKAGQAYLLPVRLPAADCTQGAANNFTDLDKVVAASPASIDLKSPSFDKSDNCSIVVPFTVKDDAPSGKDNLIFYRKSGVDKTATVGGFLPVTIQNTKPLPPSPIPPGLTAQVDIMWKVLARQAVADSYGDRVADGFFAVEATIGNNTGYDLQLAALGFDTPEFTCLGSSGAGNNLESLPGPYKGLQPTMVPCIFAEEYSGFLWMSPIKTPDVTIPVDAYPVVRGTVEREQFVGTRAIVVNLVKSSSSVLVGVGSAYLNGTGGLFNPAAAIFGTSFEKGLELVWPDLTTNHLVALDNRTLRDGVIVSNNTTVRANAFISRELVQCGDPKRWYKLSNRSSRHDYKCESDDTRLWYQRNFDPNDVMQHLGKIVLIGQEVKYLNRVRIIADKDGHQTNPGPIVSGSLQAVKSGEAKPLTRTITGSNLQDAKVVSGDPGVAILGYLPKSDGSGITFTFDTTQAPVNVLSHHQLRVNTPNGEAPVSLDVDLTTPPSSPKVPATAPASPKTNGHP